MWQYNYNANYLSHHGIKGQKWGVRRYQNPDGSLTAAGIKRYAEKGYAKDAYDSNKNIAGKIYDKYTGAHKIQGKLKYEASSNSENRKRAEQYLSDKKSGASSKTKNLTDKQKLALGIKYTGGAALTAKALSSVLHSVSQQQFFKYRTNATPFRVAVVNGSEYASKALNELGNMSALATSIQQYEYAKKYWL